MFGPYNIIRCENLGMSLYIFLFLIFPLSGCLDDKNATNYPHNPPNNLESVILQTTDGEELNWNDLKSNKATAFVFVSPECPLCENYSLSFKTLKNDFANKGVELYGVLSGGFYSSEEMNTFLDQFGLQMQVILDSQYELASYFRASVTPEVVLLDPQLETAYQGKIDNWIQRLGVKRRDSSPHYLNNAIESILSGDPIEISRTQAIGCIIE